MGLVPGHLFEFVVAVLPVGLHRMGVEFGDWALERAAVVAATDFELELELAALLLAERKDSVHRTVVAVDNIGWVAAVAAQTAVAEVGLEKRIGLVVAVGSCAAVLGMEMMSVVEVWVSVVGIEQMLVVHIDSTAVVAESALPAG